MSRIRAIRRSIPACAGEPCAHVYPSHSAEVYPRVCGGTAMMLTEILTDEGLSPRVRGNRAESDGMSGAIRSIPACAGEPADGQTLITCQSVYPRVCGGTDTASAEWMRGEGLSPRVRGNPAHPHPSPRSPRSIPACAGEPKKSRVAIIRSQVYPRVCGGTGVSLVQARRRNGLSPRVRGNPHRRTAQVARKRSIPACAGEPRKSQFPKSLEKVYPRVCGGTAP